jgi:hypothetical protein
MTILFPTFWSKVWTGQIQEGLDPLFEAELFFPFSGNPKSIFLVGSKFFGPWKRQKFLINQSWIGTMEANSRVGSN